jgi:hypothetical protein
MQHTGRIDVKKVVTGYVDDTLFKAGRCSKQDFCHRHQAIARLKTHIIIMPCLMKDWYV